MLYFPFFKVAIYDIFGCPRYIATHHDLLHEYRVYIAQKSHNITKVRCITVCLDVLHIFLHFSEIKLIFPSFFASLRNYNL